MKRALATVLLATACGGLPQPAECEQFLACSEAIAPMSTQSSKQSYGKGGTCWQNASDAAGCTEICKQALLALRLGSGSAQPECQ